MAYSAASRATALPAAPSRDRLPGLGKHSFRAAQVVEELLAAPAPVGETLRSGDPWIARGAGGSEA